MDVKFIKNKLSNNELNDLLADWIIFRDEELTRLTKEGQKHLLLFEEFEDKLLKSLPYKNREFVNKILEQIYDDFLDFCSYYNDKYYRAGFGDCLNLVIMILGGKHYGS